VRGFDQPLSQLGVAEPGLLLGKRQGAQLLPHRERSNGIWVLNESTTLRARLCTWANMRPPAALVSSISLT